MSQHHFGDPCIYCGVPHDEVPPGECRGQRTAPIKPGFYWAQWRISDHDQELPPVGTWDVVDLHINGGDPSDREYMKVSICGVERPESPENFVWGDGPLKAPGRILS